MSSLWFDHSDELSSEPRRWLHGLCGIPSVLVMSSPDADQVATRNNLSLVDLLQPHAHVSVEATIRSVETAVNIRDFRVRFVSPADMTPPPPDTSEAYLTQIVTNSAPNPKDGGFDADRGVVLRDKADVADFVQSMTERDPTPWIPLYRREFFRSLRCSTHESFDHPQASLVFVSSRNPDPIETFVQLYSPESLPPLFKDGTVDPNVLKCYVLVHDVSLGGTAAAEETYRIMKETFGPSNCRLLKINSLDSMSPDKCQRDIWSPHMDQSMDTRGSDPGQPPSVSTPPGPTPSGDKVLGQFLTQEDIAHIAEFVSEFVGKAVVPQIERRIRTLNAQVSANRKGIKNQLKSWWRKPKSVLGGDNKASQGEGGQGSAEGGALYPFSSSESQIRQLADLCFMVRDYEGALSNYRTVASDFKTDKAWIHYAGTQEMVGACLYLSDGNRREIEACLEHAYSSYQRNGNVRFATRATFTLIDIYKQHLGKLKEASGALLRASAEEVSLRAAILLEQAAYCFLQMSPSMFRKYAFHLVLAGYRYNQCGQRKHAVRCYSGALSVYSERDWCHIEDHIHFTLGRQSAHLGRLATAFEFFMKLLENDRQPADRQTTFLREFLYVSKAYAGADESTIDNLPLPRFNDKSVSVVMGDSTGTDNDPTWVALEEATLQRRGGVYTSRSEVATVQPQSVVGEPIQANVEIRNPLQVPVDITNLKLLVEVEDVDDAEGTENVYETEAQSLTLQPGVKMDVLLSLKPFRPGTFKIVGITWRLCGLVTGQYRFQRQGKRLNKTREQRLYKIYDKDLSLHVRVTGPKPHLSTALHELPPTLLHGEVRRIGLELSNFGPSALSKVMLKVTHPAFVWVGGPKDLDTSYEDGCDPDVEDGESGKDYSIIDLVDAIAPGETHLLPLWIRGQQVGIHNIHLLFIYGSEQDVAKKKARFVRRAVQLHVMPSVKVFTNVSASLKCADKYVLSVDVENLSPSGDHIQLKQLSSISPEWKIEDYGTGRLPNCLIPPGHSVSFCLRLSALPGTSIRHENVSLTGDNKLLKTDRAPCLPLILRDNVAHHRPRTGTSVSNSPQRRFSFRWASSDGQHFDADLSLALYWVTGSGTDVPLRMGQHHLFQIPIGPSNNPGVVDMLSQAPVSVRVESKVSLQHDFKSNPLCVVPITIRLCNLLKESSVSVQVEGLRGTETEADSLGTLVDSKIPPFHWTGCTRIILPDSIKSMHTASVTMRACFTRPAIYNVSRFRVTVRTENDDGPASTFYPRVQHLISVEDPAATIEPVDANDVNTMGISKTPSAPAHTESKESGTQQRPSLLDSSLINDQTPDLVSPLPSEAVDLDGPRVESIQEETIASADFSNDAFEGDEPSPSLQPLDAPAPSSAPNATNANEERDDADDGGDDSDDSNDPTIRTGDVQEKNLLNVEGDEAADTSAPAEPEDSDDSDNDPLINVAE